MSIKLTKTIDPEGYPLNIDESWKSYDLELRDLGFHKDFFFQNLNCIYFGPVKPPSFHKIFAFIDIGLNLGGLWFCRKIVDKKWGLHKRGGGEVTVFWNFFTKIISFYNDSFPILTFRKGSGQKNPDTNYWPQLEADIFCASLVHINADGWQRQRQAYQEVPQKGLTSFSLPGNKELVSVQLILELYTQLPVVVDM